MTAPSPVQALPRARFRLTVMLGAGDDGACYLGVDGDGPHVLVHRLKKLSPERRRHFEQRLKLRGLVEGGSFVEVVHVDLDADEPLIVTERISGTLSQLSGQGALERDIALKVSLSIASALQSAHRVGAPIGRLSPESVFLREDMSVALDLVAPETGAFPADPRCEAPGAEPGAAADLYALGVLISLLTTGAPPVPPDETATGVHGAPKDDVKQLVKELTDAEPAWRPSADDAVVRLEALLACAEAVSADAPTQNV